MLRSSIMRGIATTSDVSLRNTTKVAASMSAITRRLRPLLSTELVEDPSAELGRGMLPVIGAVLVIKILSCSQRSDEAAAGVEWAHKSVVIFILAQCNDIRQHNNSHFVLSGVNGSPIRGGCARALRAGTERKADDSEQSGARVRASARTGMLEEITCDTGCPAGLRTHPSNLI